MRFGSVFSSFNSDDFTTSASFLRIVLTSISSFSTSTFFSTLTSASTFSCAVTNCVLAKTNAIAKNNTFLKFFIFEIILSGLVIYI